MSEREFHPLSERYGISTRVRGLWQTRHMTGLLYDDEPTATDHRCVCPGHRGLARCRQRCTQEDSLCDECREWCWGLIDGTDTHVRLSAVYR